KEGEKMSEDAAFEKAMKEAGGVDAFLTAHGYDPDKVAQWGSEIAAAALAEMERAMHKTDGWDTVGEQIEMQITDAAETPQGRADLQRAADLVTLAEWITRPEREMKIHRFRRHLLVVLDSLAGPAYVFEGDNAIAEAAAWVRES